MREGHQVTARSRLDWIDALAFDRRLPAETFRLAHVLQSRFVNDKSGEAWPAQETLAKLLGIGERQARYHLEKLIVLGWLEKRRGGKGQPNRYCLTGNGTADQGSPLTGNEDAAQEKLLTGNDTVVDRQSGGILTGNGVADKLVENSPKNVGGSVKRPPDGDLRSNEGQHSTLKGIRDAGPSAASPTHITHQFRVGDHIDADKEGVGKCEIARIDGSTVVVRSSQTSQFYKGTIDHPRRTITRLEWCCDPDRDDDWFTEPDDDQDETFEYEDADDDAA